MSIKIPVPNVSDQDLYNALVLLLVKAVDGTRQPLLVDEKNQRVIVGGTASKGSNAALQVQGGHLEITDAGTGIILIDANGSGKRCLVQAIYDPANNNFTLQTTTAP